MSCSEGFFYDESSLVCKPKCGVWTPLSPEADMAILIISIIANVTSIAICIVILICTSCDLALLSAIKFYFWVVIYPVNYRSFSTTGRLKFIHVGVVVVSFLLPVVPLIAGNFDGGFGISLILRRKCSPLSTDSFFLWRYCSC